MHTTVKMKPVGLLYNWFGSTDWDSIASQYNIRILARDIGVEIAHQMIEA
jgi:hypothetical protein